MKALNQGLDRIHLRVIVLGIIFLSLVVALVLRLWFLQVLSASAASRQAVANIARPVPDPALRGTILDRNGQPLADNIASEVVSLDRSQFETAAPTLTDKNAMKVTPQGQVVLDRLSAVLNIPVATLLSRLNNVNADAFASIPVATNVSQDAVITIKENQATGADLFKGVTAQEEPIRNYPNATLAANVLGYVGQIRSDQVGTKNFAGDAANSIVGLSGLEQEYESVLHGTDGVIEQEVNSAGDVVGTLPSLTQPPVNGDNVVTNIDTTIQQNAEQSLAQGIAAAQTENNPTNGKKYPANAGTVIVMNPNNGQVLALASYPPFNPNQFVGGISQADYTALTTNPNDPLVNRAIQLPVAPGSTFKVVTSAAALGTGVASGGGSYPCPSEVRDYNQTFKNFESTDGSSISLVQAIAESCDTVFYQFGQTFYQRFDNVTQGEVLYNYATQFGFTKATGIDLAGEQKGIVGNAAWTDQMHQQDPKDFPYGWEPGDDIQEAIGQNAVDVTPIQIATAYAAVANGGTLYQPELANRIMNGSQVVKQIQPVVKGHLPVSGANLALIQQGLQGVVQSTIGTANAAFAGFPMAQFPIAGKTGTAEVNNQEPYAWFASYAPETNPQYVVVVMLDQGGFGAQTAAPIAKRIYQGLFNVTQTAIGQGASNFG
jgi:penicillin-binding protein 2